MTDMTPISLAEMAGVKLMNRIDTKFVAPACLLPEILRLAQQDYYVQEIDGQRLTAYDTLYYDTPTCRCICATTTGNSVGRRFVCAPMSIRNSHFSK